MRAPTQVRHLNEREWDICKSVYGDTLPYKFRIFMTDALAAGGRAFVIPTSAISVLTLTDGAAAALLGVILGKLGGLGDKVVKLSNRTGLIGQGPTLSQITSVVNLGYLVNVGPRHFPDMAASDRCLLVHEMAHVWQGKNNKAAMTFVLNSIMNQVKSDTSRKAKNGAYEVTGGGDWSSYGVEQQATIVEEWYSAGMRQDHKYWPYIRDYVRKGKT
jgi:hypothetical protein